MGIQRSPEAGDEATSWLECTLTVYVTDPAGELPLAEGIRFDLPQWMSQSHDPSFFENLYLILGGGNRMQALEDFRNGRARKRALQHVAAAIPMPDEHAVHLYACADELCELLAALDEPKATDIAKRHRYLLWPSPQQKEHGPFGRHRFRVPTLMQLAALAQEAKRSARKLRVRVDYRRRTRDATGGMSGSEPTRH